MINASDIEAFEYYNRVDNGEELPTDYQTFIHQSRYSKWMPEEKKRENWSETVQRYISNMVDGKVSPAEQLMIEDAILKLEVMPSMRAMMTAGPAADRDNTCIYNCSYLPVDDPKSFDEAMFILLCGTGVGFSVERQYINKLPEIPILYHSDTTIIVKDSKEGWAKAFRQVLALLWAGEIPKWDMSLVRPAGARLKTFGGRASGPAPLVDLFRFTTQTFKNAEGRKLSALECHDIMCFVGQIVVSGGVRRSAMISLSNLSDDRMRHAKSGQWWETAGHRALANNSVCYTEKPDMESFLREWTSLVESKSGERGIFNREASKKLQKTVGVTVSGTLGLIHAVKSYCVQTSSAILLRLWLGLRTLLTILKGKSELQLFWEQYSPPTQSFHTCERCGSVIQKKNVCLVCHSQG